MKVFWPLRRYSSPSRFALDCMRPNASEPESGSVIAHAPTLSNVSRSSAHRSFCAVVPRLMIVPGREPDADAHRGDETGRAAAQLDDRQEHEAALAAGRALLARRRPRRPSVSARRLGLDAAS